MRSTPRVTGFTLAELLVAMGIGVFLVAGIARLAQAATAGFRLQQALGQVQENARFVTGVIEKAIRAAGYRPQPWQPSQPSLAIAPGTTDAFSAGGDRLVLRRWSDHNCYDNPNPQLDVNGLPQHFLLETRFHVSTSANLALTCRYGPAADELVSQINNLGLAEGVEGLQVQFAEDADGDGNADRWIRAGQWQSEHRLLGVRFSLLLASPSPAMEPETGTFQLLDELTQTPADGRLRGVFQSAASFQGRVQ